MTPLLADTHPRALHARVSGFYVRDKALSRAQAEMTRLLAEREPTPAEAVAYAEAVRRYFTAFEREAREHLDDLDKRLRAVGQVQFNLSAERGVAAKRIEVTRAVLDLLRERDAT